jgi:hypothetical protein
MMLLLLLLYVLLQATSIDALNCSQLDIGTQETVPIEGSMLAFCQRDGLQCCDNVYFEQRKNSTQKNLENGLKEELLGGNFKRIANATDTILNFINETILSQFISRLQPINGISESNMNEVKMNFVNNLSTNFLIDANFNFSNFFDSTLTDIKEYLLSDYIGPSSLIPLNNINRNCIRVQINEKDNETVIQNIKENFNKLRRIASAVNEIKRWYQFDFIPKIISVSPVNDCLVSFIELSCTACVQNISPLCQSTCSYLTQGCYVPFKEGLSHQLDIMWNVTKQLNTQFENIVDFMFLQNNLNILTIDITETSDVNAFASQLADECSVVIQNLGAKPDVSSNQVKVPDSIRLDIEALSGSFRYANGRPIFCQANPIMKCWNGKNEIQLDNVTSITDEPIENQDINPIVSFNRTELIVQAQSLGLPVSEFLMTSFAAVAPDGIVVPQGVMFDVTIEPRPTPTTVGITTTTTVKVMPSFTSSSQGAATSPTATVTSPNPASIVTECSTLIIIILAFIMFFIF